MSLGTPNSSELTISDPAANYFKSFIGTVGNSGPIGEAALLLSQRCDDVSKFREVFARHDVDQVETFRKQILDLILDFATNQLDADEGRPLVFRDVAALKRLLRVRPNEFFKLRRPRVAQVVIDEFQKILEDLEITQTEDLELVELQRAFDLSYDEYLQIVRDTLEAVAAGVGNYSPSVQSQIEHSSNWERNLESIATLLELARRQPN